MLNSYGELAMDAAGIGDAPSSSLRLSHVLLFENVCVPYTTRKRACNAARERLPCRKIMRWLNVAGTRRLAPAARAGPGG